MSISSYIYLIVKKEDIKREKIVIFGLNFASNLMKILIFYISSKYIFFAPYIIYNRKNFKM